MMSYKWQRWCTPIAIGIYLFMGGAFAFSGGSAFAQDNSPVLFLLCRINERENEQKQCCESQNLDGTWQCRSTGSGFIGIEGIFAESHPGNPNAVELSKFKNFLIQKLKLSSQEIRKIQQGDLKTIQQVENFVQRNGIPQSLGVRVHLFSPKFRQRLEPTAPVLRR